MFMNQLRKATTYVFTEFCNSLDNIWCVSWNIIAIIDLSVLEKNMNDNDVETSKDIGKRRKSGERECKSSTIKANVVTL